jgi:hypothetical protein
MSEAVELFVISIGGEMAHEDEPDLVGRDFHHVITKDGDKVIPVFSTVALFREYVRLNLAEGRPSGHMDLMEAGDEETARALAEEHFEGVAMTVPELREYSDAVGADAIMLDPLPGRPAKVWRVRD